MDKMFGTKKSAQAPRGHAPVAKAPSPHYKPGESSGAGPKVSKSLKGCA